MPTTVAACQIRVADLAVEENVETVLERLDGLPGAVDLACFPEQALTGFVPDERVAEAAVPVDGEAVGRIHDRARATGTDILVGLVADEDVTLSNAAVYLPADGGERTVYRKRHLWAGERAVLTPGEELVTVDTPMGTAGILTCYDLNFVADSAALAREEVEALLVPGAWPATHGENWRLLVRARALDGVRWAVGAARTGRRDVEGARTTDYAGRSLVVRPDGGVRAALNTAARDLVVELDPEALPRQRELVGVFE